MFRIALSSALRSSVRVRALPMVTRCFSVSPLHKSMSGTDSQLVSKLQEELKYERESAVSGEPEFLKKFKSLDLFKIHDVVGEKEVKLTRTFGKEKITAFFSIDALNEAEEEDLGEEAEDLAYPVNMTVLVEKEGGAGCIEFSVTLQGDAFFIDHIAYGPDAQVMTLSTAEADWTRRGLYGGPVFGNLDENLQNFFHEYLAERGFDKELAEFIPEFIEHKEQKEYMNWLGGVRSFVQA